MTAETPSQPAHTGTPADLVERLCLAACEAIRNERQSLEYDVQRLRGLTLELTTANNGSVVEGRAWVERVTRPIRGERP